MASPASWNTSLVLDSVLTTSMMNYMRTLFEQVVTQNALYHRLFKKGKITTMDGGEAIIVPLMYELNDTVKFYDGFEGLDVNPQDGMAPARFEWKQLSGSVSISRKEERMNAGKNKLIGLLEAKLDQLRISLAEKLGRVAYADGSEDTNKAFLGLDALVETGSGGFSVLGGIDSDANTWWRNQALDVSGIGGGDFDATAGAAEGDVIIGETWMRQMYNSCTRGNQQPTSIFTYVTSFEEYEAALTKNQRFTDTETASHGFQNLKFKNALMFWDSEYIIGNAGTAGGIGRMYFLNEEYMKVIIDSGTNWISTPFIRPHNEDARTSQVLIMGNMVVTNRQRHGVIYGIT